MNRMQFLYGFQLKNDLIFNNNVQTEIGRNQFSFIYNVYRELPFKGNSSFLHFKAQAIFVYFFKETRTQIFMDLENTIDNFTRQ